MRILVVATGLSLLMAGCAPKKPESGTDPFRPFRDSPPPTAPRYQQVRMDTTMGEIVLELDRERAPITVANFLWYADDGAYDGTTFHRVAPSFVIQGGGWTPELKERAKAAAAAGNADVPIRNEWQNGLKNERGTIAMARDAAPDTATREFYINLVDNAKLDTAREKTGNAGYAVFGRVVKGMDVVDRIGAVATRSVEVPGVTDGSMGNVPVEVIVIRKVERAQSSAAESRR